MGIVRASRDKGGGRKGDGQQEQRAGERELAGEVWKDIPDYEGLYQVSNLGRVKSLPKYNCNQRGDVEVCQ